MTHPDEAWIGIAFDAVGWAGAFDGKDPGIRTHGGVVPTATMSGPIARMRAGGGTVMPRKTGAMLCPSCRKLISVDEPRCPFCGAMRPGLWGWGPTLQRLWGPQLDLVPVIVIACIVLYAVGLALDPRGALQARGFLNLLSPSTLALYHLGMTGGLATMDTRWWTLLTAIYLHGGLLHIFFNMMWIRQLGAEAQRAFGPARFFVIFTLTGVAGFVLSNLLGARPSIGASGRSSD
jgi:rhomboid protease GluP